MTSGLGIVISLGECGGDFGEMGEERTRDFIISMTSD